MFMKLLNGIRTKTKSEMRPLGQGLKKKNAHNTQQEEAAQEKGWREEIQETIFHTVKQAIFTCPFNTKRYVDKTKQGMTRQDAWFQFF